jgi:hypothetical protein
MVQTSGQHGGATLEYVLVSTFAAALSIAAMAYVGKLVKDRLADLGDRLGDGAGQDGDWGDGWEP